MASPETADSRAPLAGAAPRIAGVIIDLDGTLVDSVPDLAAAANLMLAELGREQRSETEIRRFVGNGVPRLVQRALSGDLDGTVGEAEFARAHPVFLRHYAEHLCERSRCYPGVEDGLERLAAAGLRLACVTNKPEAFTRPLLDRLGLLDRFVTVVAGDTLAEKKPHPAPLLHAARELGLAIGECAMIGDSASDVSASKSAGCVCVCVGYGYNQGMNLASLDPDFLVDDFASAVDRVLEFR